MLCFHPRDIRVNFTNPLLQGIKKVVRVPCGKCYACRRRRQQDWSIRLQHEADDCISRGGSAFFITFTYAPEHLHYKVDKETGEQGTTPSLDTHDPGIFMRKFRKKYGVSENFRVRFFSCGEYGDTFDRPHIHCMLFLPKKETHESLRPIVESCWPFGIVKGIYPFSVKLSEYIAKYSMKQIGDDYSDKVPPFARMSLKPAIGFSHLTRENKQLYRNSHSFAAFDSTGTPFALPRFYKEKIYSKGELQRESLAVSRRIQSANEAALRKDPLAPVHRYQANCRFEEIFKFNFALSNGKSI